MNDGFAEGVLHDLENLESAGDAGDIVEEAPVPEPRKHWVEKHPDAWTVDLDQHRGRRLVAARFRLQPVEVPKAMVDVILEWVSAGDACLYLTGANGRGKTQLGWIAAMAWLEKIRPLSWASWDEKDLTFRTMLEFFRELYRTFNDWRAPDVMHQCKTAGLLFLDDVGAEKEGEPTRRGVEELADYRSREMLPMIVTSNLSPSDLEKSQQPWLTSRLVEMTHGGKFVVHVGGPRPAPWRAGWTVIGYQEMAARVDAAVESGTDYPPMCDPAERDYWAHLNTCGDELSMARAMCRAGACSLCVYPEGPVRLCAIRDAEKPDKFGPFPLCDECAAAFDDPDAVLLRVITGVMS